MYKNYNYSVVIGIVLSSRTHFLHIHNELNMLHHQWSALISLNQTCCVLLFLPGILTCRPRSAVVMSCATAWRWCWIFTCAIHIRNAQICNKNAELTSADSDVLSKIAIVSSTATKTLVYDYPFCCGAFMKKRAVNDWNNIKLSQQHVFFDLKIFINGKIFAFVCLSHRFRGHSGKYHSSSFKKKQKSLFQRLFNPKTSSYTFICTRIRAPDT